MVYMSGAKAARYESSITNRPSGGGNKKGGLPTTFWSFTSSNPKMIRATQMLPVFNKNPYKVSLPSNDGKFVGGPVFSSFSKPSGGPNFVSRVIQTQQYGYHAVPSVNS